MAQKFCIRFSGAGPKRRNVSPSGIFPLGVLPRAAVPLLIFHFRIHHWLVFKFLIFPLLLVHRRLTPRLIFPIGIFPRLSAFAARAGAAAKSRFEALNFLRFQRGKFGHRGNGAKTEEEEEEFHPLIVSEIGLRNLRGNAP